MPNCIAMEQSAFVENRFIIDNTLVAFETNHHMKCKTKGKKGEVALKLDMSKAFNRTEWGYMKGIMRKMGLCDTCVE